jgi:glycerophosphoryl diester phosphodiesterase
VEVKQIEIDPTGFLNQTIPLNEDSKNIIEGIYNVVEGKEKFGEQVVLKWNGDYLSVFSSKNVSYQIIKAGSLDSTIYLLGYWRFATNTETGSISLQILKDKGAKQILEYDSSLSQITIEGTYGVGSQSATKELVLKFQQAFSDFVKQSDFNILAHRGGGRNSEYLGVSENTIEMINLAERFGATGVEIDIHLSKDGVPFLYHDSDINLRLTQKSVLWGNVEDFSWLQLQTLITLKNGERIPSLRDALEFILEKTTLKFVWLDLKSEKNEIPVVLEIQKEILERAAVLNRNLNIVLGLPSVDKVNNLFNIADHQNIPSLCELDVNNVRKVNSIVWAPRWTLGTQTDLVQQMHNEGRKAFVWTLDEPAFIESFMNESKFDGILTNYPTLVAYYHYIK